MAVTIFRMYPDGDVSFSPNDNGSGSWGGGQPNFSKVDDQWDAPNDADYGAEGPISSAITWSAEWTLTPPGSGVTINKITLKARLWATSQNNVPHDLTTVKGFVKIGGTRYKSSALAGGVPGTTGAQGPNPQTYTLYVLTTNPATSLAWTIPDLQDLIAGLEFVDQDFGSNTPIGWLSQFYVEVEAVTISASVERLRVGQSAYLRQFRVPVRISNAEVEPEFADLEPGDSFLIDHDLGPAVQAAAPGPGGSLGVGWGKKTWQRGDHILLVQTIRPETLGVGLEGFYARGFRYRLYAAPRTDLGYTDEGNGIPWGDCGGGRTLTRNQLAYVRKQLLDTLHAEVAIHKEKWSPDGLLVEGGGDTNRLLNSSFSQGSGSSFTNWTPAAGGSGTIAEDLANYLFDAAGLRRACSLSQGASGFENVAQTTGSTSDAYVRARIIGNMLAAASSGFGQVFYRIQRSSDSRYWNDFTAAWEVTTTSNVVANAVVGPFEWLSKLIPTSGSNTYTVTVGFLLTGTGGVAVIQQVELRTGTQAQMAAMRSPLVTTSAAVTRTADDLVLQNNATTRIWSPDRGTALFSLLSNVDHADLADGESKFVCTTSRGGGASSAETVSYKRTDAANGAWEFARNNGSSTVTASLAVSGSSLLTRGSIYAVGVRWTGTDLELDLAANTISVVVGALRADAGNNSQTYNTNENVLLGKNYAATAFGDFAYRFLEILDFCLTDEEIRARLGA